MRVDVEDTRYAWAAGVLEGEGCFSIHAKKDRPSTTTSAIHCEMTDRDIVERLKDTFGVGTINERLNISGRRDTSKRKPSYIWSVQNKQGVLEVLLRVMPYLGERRLQKAKELLHNVEERGYES